MKTYKQTHQVLNHSISSLLETSGLFTTLLAHTQFCPSFRSSWPYLLQSLSVRLVCWFHSHHENTAASTYLFRRTLRLSIVFAVYQSWRPLDGARVHVMWSQQTHGFRIGGSKLSHVKNYELLNEHEKTVNLWLNWATSCITSQYKFFAQNISPLRLIDVLFEAAAVVLVKTPKAIKFNLEIDFESDLLRTWKKLGAVFSRLEHFRINMQQKDCN